MLHLKNDRCKKKLRSSESFLLTIRPENNCCCAEIQWKKIIICFEKKKNLFVKVKLSFVNLQNYASVETLTSFFQ